MSCIDVLDLNLRRRLLRWAVVEHHKTWINKDSELIKGVCANGGVLDGKIVREIINKYQIRRVSREDSAVNWLVIRINQVLSEEGRGLIDMAKDCEGVMKAARDEIILTSKQISAITKCMWFIKRKGWTMFDECAAISLGASNTKQRSRMLDFYHSLHSRNFLSCAQQIDRILRSNGLDYLYGERVIDKFLWICGNPVVQVFNKLNEYDNKTRQCSYNLFQAANRIAEQLGDDLLRHQ